MPQGRVEHHASTVLDVVLQAAQPPATEPACMAQTRACEEQRSLPVCKLDGLGRAWDAPAHLVHRHSGSPNRASGRDAGEPRRAHGKLEEQEQGGVAEAVAAQRDLVEEDHGDGRCAHALMPLIGLARLTGASSCNGRSCCGSSHNSVGASTDSPSCRSQQQSNVKGKGRRWFIHCLFRHMRVARAVPLLSARPH